MLKRDFELQGSVHIERKREIDVTGTEERRGRANGSIRRRDAAVPEKPHA